MKAPETTPTTTRSVRSATRHRHKDYEVLSDKAMDKLPQAIQRCIGLQYTDEYNNAVSGTVSTVVRNIRTRKLYFQTWDHTQFPSAPTSSSNYQHISAEHAARNFTWRISIHKANAIVQQLSDHFMNSAEEIETDDLGYTNVYQHHFMNTAMDMNADGSPLTSNSALKGPDAAKWLIAHGEEIVRLLESETGRFIQPNEMPSGRISAYYNPQPKIKFKNGVLQYRIRGTIGGDRIDYPGSTAAFVATMETVRVTSNAAVSEDAEIMTADIENFYLGTPLDRPEYMRIALKHVPPDIIERYQLQSFIHNGYLLMEITKGIYGLKQAGKLAQDMLTTHLAKHEYMQCPNTPCLFKHKTNSVAFTLVVDDFFIKYKDIKHAEHLIKSLSELYTITTLMGNTQKYIGITMLYNRKAKYIHWCMPGYVHKALKRFRRLNLRGADSPCIYTPPQYGKHAHDVLPDPPSELLTPEQHKELQEIVGVFLFYARAVDPTMLTPLSKIASKQAKPTTLLLPDIERFLQYATKYPNAGQRIRASKMILLTHSDASYHSESEARSRAGGHIYFGDHKNDIVPNAAVCNISTIIPTVAASAVEAEYASAFIVGQAATSIMHTAMDLGYPQHTIQMISDNSCAVGIANNTVKQKRSKAIDMRYHWIRDQVQQRKISVIWKPGSENLADFFTKAHPVHHHKTMRNRYVTDTPQTKEFLEGVLILDTKVNHHVYRKQTLVDKKSTIKPVIVMSSV